MRFPRRSITTSAVFKFITYLQALNSVYISHHAYQATGQHSTLTMAQEMIQIGLSMRSSQPTTPPSTLTLSDEVASEILAAMKMHPTSSNPHCYQSELLPFA